MGRNLAPPVGVDSAKSADASAAGTESSTAGSAEEYSSTNIQVEGVDEADIVKNDGKYIYIASNNKVVIVDAYPAEEMNVISEIKFDKGVSEIFQAADITRKIGNCRPTHHRSQSR